MKAIHPTINVVPANAGTHTPRTIDIRLEPKYGIKHNRRRLWVPAFAGTTTNNKLLTLAE